MKKEHLTGERLDAVRLAAARMLGLRSGHACEAIAASLGFNTHAALTAALRGGGALPGRPDAARFRARLAGLGHDLPGGTADTALGIAFGTMPKGTVDRKPLAALLRLAACVQAARAQLVFEQPAARAMLLALQPVPDPTVSTLSVGKDTLRWNPIYVGSLQLAELRFVLAAAALHRAAVHPLRRGDRNPVLWAMACDYVVHDGLIRLRVGKMPSGGLYDKRFPSSAFPEDVYGTLAAEGRRPLASLFGCEPWKSRPPARPPTIAGLAQGRLDAREPYGWYRDGMHAVAFEGDLVGSFGSVGQAAASMAPSRRPGDAPDARAVSFGRHLARSMAGLSEAQKQRVVVSMLRDVRMSCMAASFGDVASDPALSVTRDAMASLAAGFRP